MIVGLATNPDSGEAAAVFYAAEASIAGRLGPGRAPVIGATSTTGRRDAPKVHHPPLAALFDRLTGPLERDVLGPRRASLLGRTAARR